MFNHMCSILWKQIKDTPKNKTIFIQFIMFPALTILMENTIQLDDMPAHYFTNLFAIMYLGMAPLTSMAAIISEEKEKNTLRVLLMSNVKPMEYLIGVGIYIWGICIIGAGVMGLAGGYGGKQLLTFMLIMAVGILVSMLIGAAIGTWSRNQMMAASLTIPVMMVFAFLPMIAMFNESVAKVAKIAYSQQLYLFINQIGDLQIEAEAVGIVVLNMIIAFLMFVAAYRRTGLAGE